MCGRNLGNLLIPLVAASVLVNESPRPQPIATTLLNCPRCKAAISPAFDWCPQCGYGLKTQPCAYCRNTAGIGEQFCPSCGAPAGWKELTAHL